MLLIPLEENFKQEDYRLSNGIGIKLSTYNIKNWGLSSGLNFITIKNIYSNEGQHERDPSSPSSDTTWKAIDLTHIKYHLEIPLMIDYSFVIDKLKFKIAFGCTGSYKFKDISKGTIRYLNGNIENVYYKNTLRDRFCFYPTINFGLEKKIKDFGIQLSPTIRYGVMDNSDYDWLLGITLGVYKSFS